MLTLPFLISVFLICLSLIYLYFKRSYKYWKVRGIPYLEPTIPFGNLENPFNLKIGLGHNVAAIYVEFKRRGCKQGGIFSVARPIYMPIDLDYVKYILAKDFQHFSGRGLYNNEKSDPLSAQLFTVDGQKWRNLRVKLTPVFTSGKMKGMFQTVLDCGDQMKQTLGELYLSTRTFDIKNICACFTIDVICSIAFGINCNSFTNPDSEFVKYGRQFFRTSLDRMVRNFLSLSFPKACKSLGMRLFPTEVTSFFYGVIKDVVEQREKRKIDRNDVVKLLLQIKNNDGLLTNQEIYAQSFLFFLAGFETSSSTMSFCLYLLALNPDIQDKLRQEIRKVTAKHEGNISYDSIQEMTYMTQVVEETLRMYPIVTALNRVCTKSYTLPDTDVVLEEGTKVLIPVYGIHYDPEFYPNPEVFDPERFSAEEKAKRHSFAFLPFGEGPRNCIGLRFGMMQVKIGLTVLLGQYKFSLNPKTPRTLTINPKTIVMSSIEDILLDVEKV